MKLNYSATLIATLGMSLLSQNLRANTSFNAQDLILGIRATGGTGFGTDFEMDLGPASQFYNTGPFTISAFNIADISSTFGASWNTRADLLWSVSGTVVSGGTTDHPNKTIWATAPRDPNNLSTQTSPWQRGSTFALQAPSGQIASMDTGVGGFSGAAANGALSLNATLRSSSDQNSYSTVIPRTSGTSFGYFQPTIENDMEMPGGFSINDLYEVQPGSGDSLFLGQFVLGTGGALSFQPAPEPGSISLLSLGGLAYLVWSRRFRRQK